MYHQGVLPFDFILFFPRPPTICNTDPSATNEKRNSNSIALNIIPGRPEGAGYTSRLLRTWIGDLHVVTNRGVGTTAVDTYPPSRTDMVVT